VWGVLIGLGLAARASLFGLRGIVTGWEIVPGMPYLYNVVSAHPRPHPLRAHGPRSPGVSSQVSYYPLCPPLLRLPIPISCLRPNVLLLPTAAWVTASSLDSPRYWRLCGA